MDTLETLEGAGKLAKAGNEALAKAAEYAKEARELQEAGKELSDVQSALHGMTCLGKMAGGLLAVSIGLEIAAKLFGGQTTEEQTLEAVKKIADQITALSSHWATL